MTGGFGAIPEDLRQTANKIGDVVGGVGGCVWRGASGNYGHTGVQQGWSSFVSEMESLVKQLKEKAEEHGESLITAAAAYLESEDNADGVIGKVGSLLEDSMIPGGGWSGGVADVLDLDGSVTGRAGGSIGSVLDGLDGSADEEQGGAEGIMSPERSRELFPEAGTRSFDEGIEDLGRDIRNDGPVF